MRKIAVIIVLLLLIVGVSGSYYHWRASKEKDKIREEAFLYFQEEDYEKAADLFEDLLAKKTLFSSGSDKDAESYLAESYYQLGEYEEADKVYDRLIRKNPGETRNYLLKGTCLEDQKKPEEAAACYKRGYKKTGDPALLLRTCRVYIAEKDYQEALACAEQGAEGDNRQEFLFMKIVIHEKARDYEAAYQAASDYVALYPEDEEGRKEYVFLSTRIP